MEIYFPKLIFILIMIVIKDKVDNKKISIATMEKKNNSTYIYCAKHLDPNYIKSTKNFWG